MGVSVTMELQKTQLNIKIAEMIFQIKHNKGNFKIIKIKIKLDSIKR